MSVASSSSARSRSSASSFPSNGPRPRSVLVIGGTQFMGRHLTATLLRDTNFKIGLLNRGRTKCPFRVDNRRLFHYRCDRYDSRRFRKVLRTTGPWDFVVDFLCFRRSHAKDVVRALWMNGREDGGRAAASNDAGSQQMRSLKLYVLISTDSVYMACRPPPRRQDRSGIREVDALPAVTQSDRGVVAARDDYQLEYGGNKLKAEHYLRHAWETAQFPHVALRLPDVVGPFDNLTGFLGLRRRLRRGKRIGLRIGACCKARATAESCSGRTHRISVVFAPDVAALIGQICLRAHCRRQLRASGKTGSRSRSGSEVGGGSGGGGGGGGDGDHGKEVDWDSSFDDDGGILADGGSTGDRQQGAAQGPPLGRQVIWLDDIYGQAFNVACREMPTFEQFVHGVATALDVDKSSIRWAPTRDAPMVSVDMGPVDISRAQRLLGFRPTPLVDVVRTTLEWFSKSSNRRYTRNLDRSSSDDDDDDDGNENENDGGSESPADVATCLANVACGDDDGTLRSGSSSTGSSS